MSDRQFNFWFAVALTLAVLGVIGQAVALIGSWVTS